MLFLCALKWAFNSEKCASITVFSQPLTGQVGGRSFATHLLEKSELNGYVPGFAVLDSTLF